MSFYHHLMDQDRIYEGLEAPRVSLGPILTPEQSAARNARVDRVFAEIDAQWRREKSGGKS